METATLAKTIGMKRDSDKESKEAVNIIGINRYVADLVRISEKYSFQVKVRRKNKKCIDRTAARVKKSLEQEIDGALKEADEVNQETIQYIKIKEEFNDDNILYADTAIKINGAEYKFNPEKSTAGYQELWEKTGFYQEKTYIAKVKVQLWPEHLPYDHLKRKRVFLFC